MEPQIVHFKKHSYDVYIGRPSKWGNPYSRKPGIARYKVKTRAEALNKHREWVLSNPIFIEEIKNTLKGKVLGCWCDNPLGCHGLILWKIANDLPLSEVNPQISPTLF
jgi:hypothetical protein